MTGEWIPVYRGLVLTEDQVVDLERRYGTFVRLAKHRWWATTKGVASAYATTEAVHGSRCVRVLLWGRLNGFEPTTVALPDLSRVPLARVLLDYVERL